MGFKDAAKKLTEPIIDNAPKGKIRAWLDDCPGVMTWVMAYGPYVVNWVRARFGKGPDAAKARS